MVVQKSFFLCTLSRFSNVQLFANPWTVAHQAPCSMGFSRKEYWSGCHALLQGIFVTQGSNSHLLLLLLLSRFSRVRLCATPSTVTHQAPPSLGFSRQEHWSGLPFPSPMHESEKWKWSCSVVSDPQRPHGLQPSRLHLPWDFPGKSTGVGYRCLLLHLLNWQADALPLAPPRIS